MRKGEIGVDENSHFTIQKTSDPERDTVELRKRKKLLGRLNLCPASLLYDRFLKAF